MVAQEVPRHARTRRGAGVLTRRRAVTLGLAVATGAIAVPYGAFTSASTYGRLHLDAAEWGLSIAAGIAFILLLVDLFIGVRADWMRRGFSYALTGFTWLSAAAYDALVPGQSWQWHFTHVFISLGTALVALYQWRFESLEREAS